MGQPLETHIRKLQEFYWSEADPEGRGFVPLADALRKTGDLMEAHRLLREGLSRHPDYLAAHVVYGWVSRDRDMLEDAEHWFRQALALDPRNIEALRGLGEVLLERGEIREALQYLDLLRQEDPTDLALPERVEALRTEVLAAREDQAEGALEDGLSPWEVSSGVEDEVDVESATLQPDLSEGPFLRAQDEGTTPGDLPVVEDGEPLPAEDDFQDAMVTSTLGEIYLRQGLFDQAESVFRELLERDPSSEHLMQRLQEVRDLRQGAAMAQDRGEAVAVGGGEEAPSDEEPSGEEEPSVHQGVSAGGESRGESGAAPTGTVDDHLVQVVSIESLAPDRPGPKHRSPPPEDPVAIDALAPDDPVPIDALAPEEVVSVGALAPDDPVPIDALAPDEPVSIEALAPADPVSIDALAPDEVVPVGALAPAEPVSIETLAPADPVSIDTLAPEQVVSIDTLAPDRVVSIESLAPGDGTHDRALLLDDSP